MPLASLIAEALLTAIVIALALFAPRFALGPLGRIYRALDSIARRPALSILVAGAAPVVLRLLLLPVLPVPVPFVQDEFSHLLLGDTFANGRLSNPTHPMWRHFETFHVLQRPTYSSQYPPGTGLLLAAGQVVLGMPWAGVVAGVALMCAATCWMLRAWAPPRWAFLGAVLLGLRLGVFSYWMNSYWGGALAAAGGALVLGGFGWMRRRRRILDPVLLGLGTLILAATRPYEGLLICAPVYLMMLPAVLQRRQAMQPAVSVAQVAALGAVLAAGGSFYLLHNRAVTGHPFVLPYQVAQAQYGTVQALPGMRMAANTELPSPEMRKYQNMQSRLARERLQGANAIKTAVRNMYSGVRGLFGPLLVLALLPLPWILRRRRVRPLVIVAAVFLAGMLVHIFFHLHYAAPGVSLGYLFVVLGLRRWSVAGWKSRPVGLFLARAIPVACVLSFALSAAASPWLRHVSSYAFASWNCCTLPGNVWRDAVIRELEQLPDKHLVIVRYGPKHSYFEEWVYNAADIDGSRIVWARGLDEESNRRLLDYYRNRQVWIVEPGSGNNRPQPYRPE